MSVVGSSMEPVLRSGDWLLVDRTRSDYVLGDIIVFRRSLLKDAAPSLVVKFITAICADGVRVAGTGGGLHAARLGTVEWDEIVGVARGIIAPLTRMRRLRRLDPGYPG